MHRNTFFSVQIALARLNRISLAFYSMFFLVFCWDDLLVKLQASERVSRNRPEPFSKCVGECCQPGKLSIDQKDSEKIAIGT